MHSHSLCKIQTFFVAIFISFFLTLQAGAKEESPGQLVEIRSMVPDAILEVRYASSNNFLKAPLYPIAKVFLRKSTAEKLKKAADQFRSQGYRLKVFDGYRPLSVQKKMWSIVPDPRYVANPKFGSMHNRGGAVDLTLAKLDGSEIEMPSDYDEFSRRAHQNYPGGSAESRKNRDLLRKGMEATGFESISSEWWHYQDPDSLRYPVLDVPLEKL